MKYFRLSALALIGAIGALGIGSADAAPNFKGKKVSIIVGSGAGGGYDTYSRTLARHWGQHVPGNPKFLVKNRPGAGSVVATNFIYNVAKQDGTVVGGVQRNIPFLPIFGQKGPQYDPVKINWLGSLNSEVGVFVVFNQHTKIRTLQDAMVKEVIFGGSGPNDTEIFPALANNTLGTKIRIITGYPGSTNTELAMRRGEVQGYTSSFSSLTARNPKWKTEFTFLAQNALKPHPTELKNVPLITDLVSNPEHKLIWKLMLTQKVMGRPYMLGPKVPKDVVKMMRASFEAVAQDKGFMADAKKQKRDVVFVSGSEIQGMIAEVAATPKSIIAKMDTYTRYKGVKQKVKIGLARHTGKVTKTKRGGRRIYLMHKGKEVKAKVSGSRTLVMVNDKKAKRKAIKVGMTCTFVYPGAGQEAKQVLCKK
ncbi:MAG: Bug family tripartite tricarboxylate transporter substrate binding protein [Alphaproteobacteria bacterium]|jgi:tripartite-type tricarboxylate transporter receptor subunit TctC